MPGTEGGGRLERVQTGGVLVLQRPGPGEAIVHDAANYALVDFRPLFGEWQSMTREGGALVLGFGGGGSVRLDRFFDAPAAPLMEVQARVGDQTIVSAEAFFQLYATLEERRAASDDEAAIPAGAHFEPTPPALPLAGITGSLLLADEEGLVLDDLPPEPVGEDPFATDFLAPPEDPPIATPVDLGSIDEGGSRVITAAELLAGASDPDGGALIVVALALASGSGALVDNGDGTWTYTPAPDDDSEASFTYTVTDGTFLASSTASLDILPDGAAALMLGLAAGDSGGGSDWRDAAMFTGFGARSADPLAAFFGDTQHTPAP